MGAGAIISPFLSYNLMIKVSAGSYIPGIALTVFSSVVTIRRKVRESFFYGIAFFSLLSGVVITVFNRFGVLNDSFATLWAFQIGSIISIALFSFGLADKVNTLTRELADMNINLEEKVNDRTSALVATKSEVEAAMEELEAMNERLIETNRDLEEAHEIQRKDLTMASYVQKSFLPQEVPLSPNYDVAYTTKAASVVSGDFYDFYTDDNGIQGIGIFDVAGHGISSGLLTLMAKSVINRGFQKYVQQSFLDMVEKINEELISEIKPIGHYLTGIFLRFRGPEVDYINCAHPDMIIRREVEEETGRIRDKNGKRISGPFLGIDLAHSTYQDADPFQGITFNVKPGDSLLLYTDSLIESTNSSGEDYQEHRIIKSFRQAPDGSAAEILEHVTGEFIEFIGGEESLKDDPTIIIVRKK
jgi:sigma-B regulation protein RsbU (phosphoserine phosphatase)